MMRGMAPILARHFGVLPLERDRNASRVLSEKLVADAGFDAFVKKRLQGTALSHSEHLDPLRQHVRPYLEDVLNTYCGNNYVNYLLRERTRRITEYLQRFAEDVRPRKPPFRT